jgi:hypothetical protein
MRLLLVPWIGVAAALLTAPLSAQPALPARTFEPSVAAVTPAPAPPVRDWWRSGGPRIRPTDQRVAAILRNGLERSPRLRALVGQVEGGSVFVYLGMDPRIDGALAGRLTFVGDAGKYRYLRVAINPVLGTNLIVASIAHELQHVVEVIEHPEVTSESGLRTLYERIGQGTRAGGVPGFETRAAVATTYQVRRELKGAAETTLVRQESARPDLKSESPRRN